MNVPLNLYVPALVIVTEPSATVTELSEQLAVLSLRVISVHSE